MIIIYEALHNIILIKLNSVIAIRYLYTVNGMGMCNYCQCFCLDFFINPTEIMPGNVHDYRLSYLCLYSKFYELCNSLVVQNS